MADNIAASDVTCSDEQKVELKQLKIALEEIIVRTEASLALLQIALEDATGTTAAYGPTTAKIRWQSPV